MSLFGPQNTAQALDILALRTIAAHNDRHATIRHIDALVEHAARRQLGIVPCPEALQDHAALLGRLLVSYRGHAEATTDLIDDIVILREEDHQIVGMHA